MSAHSLEYSGQPGGFMKSMILFSAVLLSATVASAQEMSMIRTSGEIEASCRIKAKEIAAETYRGCVTDQKNSQIEQIKKEYAAKLQALKAHYDQELKKMSGSKAKADEASPIEQTPAEKTEKTDSVSTKSPSKKQKSASSTPAPKKVAKKAPAVPAPGAKSEVSEMTVQLKPSPGTPSMDESTMDLPEPIPMDEPVMDTSI
jgi:hypothetical protein